MHFTATVLSLMYSIPLAHGDGTLAMSALCICLFETFGNQSMASGLSAVEKSDDTSSQRESKQLLLSLLPSGPVWCLLESDEIAQSQWLFGQSKTQPRLAGRGLLVVVRAIVYFCDFPQPRNRSAVDCAIRRPARWPRWAQ